MILRTRVYQCAMMGLLLSFASASAVFAQGNPGADEAAQRQAAQLRRLQQQLQSQQQELTAAMNELQAQLAAVKQQAAATAAPPTEKEPLGKVRVFRLRLAGAQSVGNVLKGVLGEKVRRMATDPSTNSLVLSVRDEDFESITQLIEQLDVPTDPSQVQNFAETLQLRFIWLAGGLPDSDLAPASSVLDTQVVQAVESLGVSEPRVLCQHVTSVAKRTNENANFGFTVPAGGGPTRLVFEGQGELAQNNSNQFQIQMSTALSIRADNESKNGWQMSGSVAMPLRHYVVMGTTNLVLETSGGKWAPRPAAFVVYLDRANTYTEESPASPRGRFGGGRGGRGRRSQNAEANPFGVSPSGEQGRGGSQQPAEQKNAGDNPFKE